MGEPTQLQTPVEPAPQPVTAARAEGEDQLVEENQLVEEDLLIEEVSIDGMCGVY